jgi:hypothetical protein
LPHMKPACEIFILLTIACLIGTVNDRFNNIV